MGRLFPPENFITPQKPVSERKILMLPVQPPRTSRISSTKNYPKALQFYNHTIAREDHLLSGSNIALNSPLDVNLLDATMLSMHSDNVFDPLDHNDFTLTDDTQNPEVADNIIDASMKFHY